MKFQAYKKFNVTQLQCWIWINQPFGALLVRVCMFLQWLGYYSFLPQSKAMHVRLTSDSEVHVNSNPRPPSKSWKYKKDQNLKHELLAHFKCNLALQHKKILRAVLFPMDNEITDFCYCCCYYFIVRQLIDHSVKCQNTDGYKVGLLCNIRMNKQWCFSYISYITTSH